MWSAPSQSIQTCLSHCGQGSAKCQTASRDDRSYASRTSSGSRQIRFIMVGTRYTVSALYRSIASSVATASKRGRTAT